MEEFHYNKNRSLMDLIRDYKGLVALGSVFFGLLTLRAFIDETPRKIDLVNMVEKSDLRIQTLDERTKIEDLCLREFGSKHYRVNADSLKACIDRVREANSLNQGQDYVEGEALMPDLPYRHFDNQ